MSDKVLTPAEVAEILERAEKATPGPWRMKESHGRDCIWLDVVHGKDEDEIACGETQPQPSIVHSDYLGAALERKQEVATDLEFIAHARTDIPALCATITRLRGLIDGMGHEYQCDSKFHCGNCNCVKSQVNL